MLALSRGKAYFALALNSLRPDFTSKLEHGLAFGTSKFYIAPYLSCNCDVKSGLRADFTSQL